MMRNTNNGKGFKLVVDLFVLGKLVLRLQTAKISRHQSPACGRRLVPVKMTSSPPVNVGKTGL